MASASPALTDAHATVFARGIAHAASDRVATAVMQMIWGHPGATLTAILVMVSTFGCANGLILTGARVIYAMARDGSFFAAAGRLNSASVPAFALILQGGWAALLTLSGSYSQLLDYVIFAQLLFYALTVASIFVLAHSPPDAPRPYRAWGYPWVPFFYIVAAVALMVDLLIVRPAYTWPGLLIALSGAPIYLGANIFRQRALHRGLNRGPASSRRTSPVFPLSPAEFLSPSAGPRTPARGGFCCSQSRR